MKYIGFDPNYAGIGRKFIKKSGRPGTFSTSVKKKVTKEFNKKFNTSFDHKKAFAANAGLSINHKLSWENICQIIAKRLSLASQMTSETGARASLEYMEKTLVFRLFFGDSDPKGKLRAKRLFNSLSNVFVSRMASDGFHLTASSCNKISQTADVFAKQLNNCADNVRLGFAKPNAIIGKRFDPELNTSIGGTYHRTKGVKDLQGIATSGLRTTPGNTRIHASNQKSPVPLHRTSMGQSGEDLRLSPIKST